MTKKSYAGNVLKVIYQICPRWLLFLKKVCLISELKLFIFNFNQGIAYTLIHQIEEPVT